MKVYKYTDYPLDLAARVYIESNPIQEHPAFATSIMAMLGETKLGTYESDKACYSVSMLPNSDEVTVTRVYKVSELGEPDTREKYIPRKFVFKLQYNTSDDNIEVKQGNLVVSGMVRDLHIPRTKQQKVTFCKPHPKHVLENFKGPKVYTTVVWQDGTHTIVKKAAADEYDLDKALLFAIVKKMCNDNGCDMARYIKEFTDNLIEK